MRTTEDSKTIEAMLTYGGSFIKALGEAALRADNVNLARLKKAWPEYWSQYEMMSKATSEAHRK